MYSIRLVLNVPAFTVVPVNDVDVSDGAVATPVDASSERIFPDAFGYQLVMYIQNKHNEHLEVEYLEVRYLWFQDHHPFFCHTYLRWHEIQQLMNHKK